MIDSEKIESPYLNEMAHKVKKFKNAAAIIREYEETIQTKKTNICIEYQKHKVCKRFEEKEKFIQYLFILASIS